MITRSRSNTTAMNIRITFPRINLDIEPIPEFEEGEDADDEYYNPLTSMFTM